MRERATARPEDGRPTHASVWAWFPRRPTVPAWLRCWPGVTAVVGAAALALATLTPPLHGALHLAAATPQHRTVPRGALAVSSPGASPGADAAGAGIVPVVLETTAAAAPAPSTAAAPAAVSALAADGIPVTALRAYQQAAARADTELPGCHLPWPLLAAIGRVESDHGRFGGAVLYSDGTSSQRILGIVLDGTHSALIRDTDHGRLDGNTVYDRAVGPMQFIPSTWASYGVDANGDGVADPFNIFDAAAAAARYLCVAGGDLGTLAGQARAVLAYNHSTAYLTEVLGLERVYAAGVGLVVPVGPPPPPTGSPTLPPVDPGPPLGRPPAPPGSHSSAPTSSGAAPSGPSDRPTGSSTAVSSPAPSCTGTPPTGSTAPVSDPAPSDPASDPAPSDPAPTDSPAGGTPQTDAVPTDAGSGDPGPTTSGSAPSDSTTPQSPPPAC